MYTVTVYLAGGQVITQKNIYEVNKGNTRYVAEEMEGLTWTENTSTSIPVHFYFENGSILVREKDLVAVTFEKEIA